LIAKTTTETGLRVRAALDKNSYPTGIKVTDDELASVNLRPAKIPGQWNYIIKPSG
jgi:Rhodopirellula transposase DDE domain